MHVDVQYYLILQTPRMIKQGSKSKTNYLLTNKFFKDRNGTSVFVEKSTDTE